MPAGDPELPATGMLPPTKGAPSGGGDLAPAPPGGANPAASNRPIPVRPTSENEIPEAYDEYAEEDEVDELHEVLKNAPAWLVSTVFHMVLLLVVAMLAAGAERLTSGSLSGLELEPPEMMNEQFAEQLGTQLDDPSALIDSNEIDKLAKEQMITPRNLEPVDDPLAAPPKLDLADMNFTLGSGPNLASSDISAPMIGLALHGRRAGSRNVLLGRYGGTATTEAAVEKGLQWLVQQQRADGSWSLTGPYPGGALSENDAAATAMALLALQGHGDTHRDGVHTKVVAKAYGALLKWQRRDGCITGTMAESSHLLYTHAQCTIALCELYGMTRDSAYRPAAERAVAFLLSAQDPRWGGWRYEPRNDSDTSVTGWVTMALESARMAGLRVPNESLKRVGDYLDLAQTDDGRRYGYTRSIGISPAMSAVGLLCRQYLGWNRDDPRLVDGVKELVATPIKYDGVQDVYYWYYAAQAAHHMEGNLWDDWNKVMRQEVPAHQVRGGAEAGSWEPIRDKWGAYGGRLYVTCLSICMLEVYYRHLPIYSADRFVPPSEDGSDPADKLPTIPDREPAAADDEAKD